MTLRSPCKHSDCVSYATYKGYCKRHARPQWTGNRKDRLPGDWATRQRFVIKRDEGICYLCGEEGADGVDHVRPGDDHSYDNLKAVHHNVKPYCHRYKSSREGNAAQGHNIEPRVARKEPEVIDWGF